MKNARAPSERMAQWDRTIKRFGSIWEIERGYKKDWWLGEIVQNTRLLLRGDHVLVVLMNGGGERQPIYAVSGKGIHLRRYFIQYRTSGCDLERQGVDRRRDRDGFFEADHGPLRFVECPGELAGAPPFHPDVRRFVEAHVRAIP